MPACVGTAGRPTAGRCGAARGLLLEWKPAGRPGSQDLGNSFCARGGAAAGSEPAWASLGACFLRTCSSDRTDALAGKKPWIGGGGGSVLWGRPAAGQGWRGSCPPAPPSPSYPVPFCWLGGCLAVTRRSCPRPARLGPILPLLPACSQDSGCAKKPHT